MCNTFTNVVRDFKYDKQFNLILNLIIYIISNINIRNFQKNWSEMLKYKSVLK